MNATQLQAKLTESYRDKVTGFAGIATGRAEYAHGPTMVLLENDNANRWVEESRLEEVR